MTTKERIKDLLTASKGEFLSGEDIAGRLSVSRAAVWKAIKSLQADGYTVDASTKKGYRLALNDVPTAEGIEKYLGASGRVTTEILKETTSTNAVARERATQNTEEIHVVIAEEQTAGRGRLGRSFFSPKGTGVYMSLLLRPHRYSPTQTVRLTTIAAVAMCEAIEAISDKKAQIKWVNDIFIDGKKVCGILTEASIGLESGLLDYAVLGVGVNVYAPSDGFPTGVSDIAGAVLENKQNDAKNRLIARFLHNFIGYYDNLSDNAYAEKYRERSLVIGKKITVIRGGTATFATALALDDDCRLSVRYDDGREEILSSGEISIRV